MNDVLWGITGSLVKAAKNGHIICVQDLKKRKRTQTYANFVFDVFSYYGILNFFVLTDIVCEFRTNILCILAVSSGNYDLFSMNACFHVFNSM